MMMKMNTDRETLNEDMEKSPNHVELGMQHCPTKRFSILFYIYVFKFNVSLYI